METLRKTLSWRRRNRLDMIRLISITQKKLKKIHLQNLSIPTLAELPKATKTKLIYLLATSIPLKNMNPNLYKNSLAPAS